MKLTHSIRLVCVAMFIEFAILFLAVSCGQALPIREALSQVESGSNDKARGRAGEVSRYQILPSIWREHTRGNHRNPDLAWYVARRILAPRCLAFKAVKGRQPDHRELYALWNKPGLFERRGYRWERLPGRVRERAKRFENLVKSK